MKIGRNKPCWCGSNKKYKHCHLGRDKQAPIDKGTVMKEMNSFNSKKFCSVPEVMKTECSKKIIKAHSVSKGSSLKAIAEDGHVYTTFKTNHDFSVSKIVRPKKVGINQASVFTGFCSNHDKQIFAPIEDDAFNKSAYHCFLVAYRSLCRELFVKESAANTFSFAQQLDKGKSLSEQVMIQQMAKYYGSNNDLTTGDLQYLKQKLDQMFTAGAYDDLHHLVVELEHPARVMTSAVLGYTDWSGVKDFRNHVEIGPKQLNNITAPNVLEKVWDLFKDKEPYDKLNWTLVDFFSIKQNLICPDRPYFNYQKVTAIYNHLNFIGFHPDSNTHIERRFIAAMSDLGHASIASFADNLFSIDEDFVIKTRAAYEYLGVRTKVHQVRVENA